MAVAGTVTTTTTDLGAGLFEYSMAWVCDASGAVTENAVAVKRGYIRSVEFIPDGGGTAPSAAYDVTLIDAISVGADFVSAAGANLSATARSIATPNTLFKGGNLYPTVANAGNAKGGTIVLVVGP